MSAPGRAGRLAAAGVAAGVAGVGAALAVLAVAVHKGFVRVLASGDGEKVFVVMAIVGAVFGYSSFGLVVRWLDRRAERRAVPQARLRR